MFKIHHAVLPLLALVLAAPTLADETPISTTDPFMVNTTTGNLSSPAIAGSGNGDFVIAWRGYVGAEGTSILAQRLDADGSLAGGEILVVSDTTAVLPSPRVAMDSSGGFVVVWSQSDIPMASSEVKARRYNASGAALGSEFVVNSYSTGNQFSADIAAHPSGSFVVTWSSSAGEGNLLAQRFDASGQPVGSQLVLVPASSGVQMEHRVSIDDLGDFVVAWRLRDTGQPEPNQIQARRFASNGQPQGATLEVTAPSTYSNSNVDVDRKGDGEFVVSWSAYTGPASDLDIFARRYDSAGSPAGAAFQVHVATTGYQFDPTVALNDDGSFLVSWIDGSFAARGQRFTPEDLREGDIFAINVESINNNNGPGITDTVDGRFLTTWVDNDSQEVFGRAFRVATVFADGFESGDVTAWSTSAP